jgi:hypothetical protein
MVSLLAIFAQILSVLSLQNIIFLLAYLHLGYHLLFQRMPFHILNDPLARLVHVDGPQRSVRVGLALTLVTNVLELLNCQIFVFIDDLCMLAHNNY